MNGLLTLVAASAAGGVLFVLLFALRPLTSRLFSKTWHYYMLYVPVFFLLGGGLLAGRLGGFAASFFPQLPPIATAEAMTVAGLATGGDAVSALPSIPAIAVWEALPTLPEPLTQNAPALLMSVAPAFVALWAMGAVVFLAVNIRNYRAYRRLLLNGSRLISQKSNVGIIASPTASMPMLIGVLQPKIILPDGGFTEAELNMMLLHELAHHRRRDMWLKLIMLVCNAVHWFNPIAYLLSRHVNNLCEMSCDEKVVKAFDFEQRKLYGETILSVLEHRLARKNVVCIIGLCSSKKAIKRRLNNMMNVKKVKKSIIALSLAVSALVVGVGAAVAYSLVSAMPDTDEAPPEAHSASDYEKAAEAPPDEPEAYQIDEIACQAEPLASELRAEHRRAATEKITVNVVLTPYVDATKEIPIFFDLVPLDIVAANPDDNFPRYDSSDDEMTKFFITMQPRLCEDFLRSTPDKSRIEVRFESYALTVADIAAFLRNTLDRNLPGDEYIHLLAYEWTRRGMFFNWSFWEDVDYASMTADEIADIIFVREWQGTPLPRRTSFPEGVLRMLEAGCEVFRFPVTMSVAPAS